MLTENQINLLPERIYQRLNDINTDYLESIGRTLKEIGRLRPTDVHKLQQMYSYGEDIDRITQKLADASGKNIQEIYEIFDIVAKENYNYSKPFYDAQGLKFIPYEQNENLQRYVKSIAKQTVDEYVNLTQHTAFAVFAKDGKSIAPLFAKNKDKIATSLSDTYTKIVDYAVTKVQLGETDYQSAVREVIRAMTKSGIKTVDYATGYSRRLDTTVRQNILWGAKQCNQGTADLIGEEFGADGYEISYHSNPRPTHADMGGKQYAIGKARTVNGIYYPSFSTVAHLLEEYNCSHFKFPILLGISRPAYSDDELAELKANDKKTFEFEGNTYTGYEGTQMQRNIETEIRKQKDIANMAKAAGDDDLRREAQGKINVLKNKYVELSKASGLPTKMERASVAGFRPVKAKLIETERGITKKRVLNTSENNVDLKLISSKEYRDKFLKLPYSNDVCESVYTQSKAMLEHRKGTYYEDICLIDSTTGKVKITCYNNKTTNEVYYSKKAEKIIADNPHKLIAIHNHGTNNPPTGSDFVSAGYRKYKSGIVLCHDGTVYKYSVGKNPFTRNYFDLTVDKYQKRGYTEKESILKTLNDFSNKYGIEWSEL